MRSATLVTLGSSLTAVFIVVACASSEDAPTSSSSGDVTKDAGNHPSNTIPEASTTSDPPAPPPKKCVTKCTADTDCANSCPAPLSGAYCCDIATGTCYNNATSTCPKPTPDAGEPPPAY